MLCNGYAIFHVSLKKAFQTYHDILRKIEVKYFKWKKKSYKDGYFITQFYTENFLNSNLHLILLKREVSISVRRIELFPETEWGTGEKEMRQKIKSNSFKMEIPISLHSYD